MADDLRKIKDWLRQQETEEPIPGKSQDRVFTSMARSIRANRPLPTGACHTCGGHAGRLVPVQMKVCPNCLRRFTEKGGPQRVLGSEVVSYYCDNCFGKTLTPVTINPLVCQKCARKMGRFHKQNLPELRLRQKRDERKLPFVRTVA